MGAPEPFMASQHSLMAANSKPMLINSAHRASSIFHVTLVLC